MSKKTNAHLHRLYQLDIGREQVWQLIVAMRNTKDSKMFAALTCWLFLFGNRITEVVGGKIVRREYWDPDLEQWYKSIKEIPPENRLRVRLNMHEKEYKLPALKTYSWQRVNIDGQDFIRMTAPVLKHKDLGKSWHARLAMVNELERPFIDIVELYLAERPANAEVFPNVNPLRYWRYLRKICKGVPGFGDDLYINPHFFRHLRHRLLVREYGYNTSQLKDYSNWKTLTMPAEYGRQTGTDLAHRMIEFRGSRAR